jgi:hypothetical protein
VRRGRHRDGIATRIDPACFAQREDARESLDKGVAELRRVEEDPTRLATRARGSLLAEDLARDDVARRQVAEAVSFLHESIAAIVAQYGSFAAHRLRDEGQRILGGVECSRVELNELHVDKPHARPPRDRVAVARSDDGIRRVAVHLPTSAGGEDGGVGNDLDRASGDAGTNPEAFAVAHDEIEYARCLDHVDVLALAHALDQCTRHFGSRLIAVCVHDTIARVRGFAAELEAAARCKVEAGAGGEELLDARWSFLHQDLDGFPVAQGRPGCERIAPVQCR